jgi:hypothetical protein
MKCAVLLLFPLRRLGGRCRTASGRFVASYLILGHSTSSLILDTRGYILIKVPIASSSWSSTPPSPPPPCPEPRGTRNDSGTRVRAAAGRSRMTSSTPRRGRQFSVRRKEVVGRLLLGVAVQHEWHVVQRGRRVHILDPVHGCHLEAELHRIRAIGKLGEATVTAPSNLRSFSKVPTSTRGALALRFRAEGVVERLGLEDMRPLVGRMSVSCLLSGMNIPYLARVRVRCVMQGGHRLLVSA